MNVNVIGGNYNQQIGTIYTGGSLSFAGTGDKSIDLSDGGIYGMVCYGTAVVGSLTFHVSHQPGGPFVPVLDETDGSYYDPVIASSAFALKAEALACLLPYRYVRVMFSAVQTNGLSFYITQRA